MLRKSCCTITLTLLTALTVPFAHVNSVSSPCGTCMVDPWYWTSSSPSANAPTVLIDYWTSASGSCYPITCDVDFDCSGTLRITVTPAPGTSIMGANGFTGFPCFDGNARTEEFDLVACGHYLFKSLFVHSSGGCDTVSYLVSVGINGDCTPCEEGSQKRRTARCLI